MSISKSLELNSWKLLAQLNRVSSMPFHDALKLLNTSDKNLWEIIKFIQTHNHIFYNPSNIKWFDITKDMHLMVITDEKTKKMMLKELKMKIKELKATIKGAYYG